MEVDEPPRMTAQAAAAGEEAPPAAIPDGPGAKKKRSTAKPAAEQRNVTVAGEEATPSEATSSRQTLQTKRAYFFSETEFVDLLIGFQRLVDQEHEAGFERIPHWLKLPRPTTTKENRSG